MHDSGRAATPTALGFAWTGAGAFVLALIYFVYSYYRTFGVPTEGTVDARSILLDVALFSGFALHHSVFAREPVRQWVAQRFPGLERSVYVWVASILFASVCWLWRPVAGIVWELDGPLAFALLSLQSVGIVLSVYSASLIDIWDLAGVSVNSQRPDPNTSAFAPEDPGPLRRAQWEFITQGPYGLVRHPIYLGWFLIVWCVGTMTMTRFVFALVSCVYVLVAIPFEERSLRTSSQGAYDRYMKLVPRKLVPGVY